MGFVKGQKVRINATVLDSTSKTVKVQIASRGELGHETGMFHHPHGVPDGSEPGRRFLDDSIHRDCGALTPH